jgi:hypothetical protein
MSCYHILKCSAHTFKSNEEFITPLLEVKSDAPFARDRKAALTGGKFGLRRA